MRKILSQLPIMLCSVLATVWHANYRSPKSEDTGFIGPKGFV